MLDVEVIGRVKDGKLFRWHVASIFGRLLTVWGRNGDLGERTLLVLDLESGGSCHCVLWGFFVVGRGIVGVKRHELNAVVKGAPRGNQSG